MGNVSVIGAVPFVGGRNLYKGTRDFSGDVWISLNSWKNDGEVDGFSVKTSTTQYQGLQQWTPVHEGEIYTFSCWGKRTENAVFSFHTTGTNADPPHIIFYIPANVWTRVSITFKIVKNGSVYPRFENGSKGANSTDNTISVYGLKLERGNVPTDWSPAPEDIFDRLAALEAAAGISYEPPQIDGPTMDEPADTGGVIRLSCYASERRWAA